MCKTVHFKNRSCMKLLSGLDWKCITCQKRGNFYHKYICTCGCLQAVCSDCYDELGGGWRFWQQDMFGPRCQVRDYERGSQVCKQATHADAIQGLQEFVGPVGLTLTYNKLSLLAVFLAAIASINYLLHRTAYSLLFFTVYSSLCSNFFFPYKSISFGTACDQVRGYTVSSFLLALCFSALYCSVTLYELEIIAPVSILILYTTFLCWIRRLRTPYTKRSLSTIKAREIKSDERNQIK